MVLDPLFCLWILKFVDCFFGCVAPYSPLYMGRLSAIKVQLELELFLNLITAVANLIAACATQPFGAFLTLLFPLV